MSDKIKNITFLSKQTLFVLSVTSILCSCATSQKGKIVEWTFLGAAIGGAYGTTRLQEADKNALMYGALGAALGAMAGLYYFDPDKFSEKLANENQNLKKELDLIQSPKVLFETPATFNTKIPEKYKKLINPGEWKISEINQWVEESENRLIHQDKIMELVPPTLNPNLQGPAANRDRASH